MSSTIETRKYGYQNADEIRGQAVQQQKIIMQQIGRDFEASPVQNNNVLNDFLNEEKIQLNFLDKKGQRRSAQREQPIDFSNSLVNIPGIGGVDTSTGAGEEVIANYLNGLKNIADLENFIANLAVDLLDDSQKQFIEEITKTIVSGNFLIQIPGSAKVDVSTGAGLMLAKNYLSTNNSQNYEPNSPASIAQYRLSALSQELMACLFAGTHLIEIPGIGEIDFSTGAGSLILENYRRELENIIKRGQAS